MPRIERKFYVWIDPPGDNPGWVYTCTNDGQVAKAMANHDIPEDNDEIWREYVETSGGTKSVEEFQAGRRFWGVTVLDELPTDLPQGIEMVK